MLDSAFVTEIVDINKQANLKFRHRKEIEAIHFEQIDYFSDEEDQRDNPRSRKNNNKYSEKYQNNNGQKRQNNKEQVDDSSESDSDDESFCSEDSDSSSCISNSDCEEHDIWDNSDFEIHGIDLDNLKFCKNQEQNFYTLYKLRYLQIRDVLKKKLTQKQHLDTNINILKIIKCLSDDTIQSIQCHNYNYFQPLNDNEKFQKFDCYFKQFNSNRRVQQEKQKSQFIINLKQKPKKSSFSNIPPQAFQGTKSIMNRASFSSIKETILAENLVTADKSKQSSLVGRSLQTNGSLPTQDTFTYISKRTIKDFDLESNQKVNQISQMQSESSITAFPIINQKIESLTHITEICDSCPQIQKPSIILNNSMISKNFKISQIANSKAYLRSVTLQQPTSTQLITKQIDQQTSFTPPIKIQSEQCNAIYASGRASNSNNISLDQLKINGLNNSNLIEFEGNKTIEFLTNNFNKTPIQKSQNKKSSLKFQNNLQQFQKQTTSFREMNQIYYSLLNSPNCNQQDVLKNSYGSANSQNSIQSKETQERSTLNQKQEEGFLPKIENLQQQILEVFTVNNQQNKRTASNNVKKPNNPQDNNDCQTPSGSVSTSTPSSNQNKSQELSDLKQKYTFTQAFSSKLFQLENQRIQNNDRGFENIRFKTLESTIESTSPIRICKNKIYASPMSSKNINQLSQRQQNLIPAIAQLSNIQKQGNQVKQSQQEYLLSNKLNTSPNQLLNQTNLQDSASPNQQQQCNTQHQNRAHSTVASKLYTNSNNFFKNKYIISNTTPQNNKLLSSFKLLTKI